MSPSETSLPQRPERARLGASLAGPLLVTLLLRLVVIVAFAPPPSWDGTIYAALARSLASGQGYVHWDGSGRATAFFPVGYPAAIALALRVVRSTDVAVWAVNVVASIVGCALVRWTAARLAGPRAGRRAAWAYALYPSLVLFSAAAMTETLQSTLLIATLALVVAAHPASEQQARTTLEGRSFVAAALAGVVLGLACFVRPQAIVLAPVVGALCGTTVRRRVGLAFVATAVVLALAAPWAARNARALDAPTLYSTNGGSNLLIGTLASARGGYRELTARDPCGLVAGEVRRDRCMTRAALARIAEAPAAWLALAPRKALKVLGYEWSAVSYLRSSSASFPQRIATPLAVVCTLAWWTLVALATRAFAARRRVAPEAREGARATRWFTAAAAASVLVVHVAFIADDRYHLVLVPLLIVLGAATLETEK
ncbi:MAG: glycosyltransferase family 39 protein [Myxococcales bacterium]|nr:glycosyltransferase family 39 protein [Myxococcales bacterium]